MLAFVTSIGEPTTDLCVWSLKRNGFEVVLIKDDTILADKLSVIYHQAEDDFVRVDADVIPNKDLTAKSVEAFRDSHIWWMQYLCFDWYKQQTMYGGVQYIKKEALPALRENIVQYRGFDRPETMMSRLPEFHNPRRFDSYEFIFGLHGYHQSDIERVKAVKERRGQSENYDWELVDRIEAL